MRPGGRGGVPAIAQIWRGEPQRVAGSEATILSTAQMKCDLLAVTVQLEPSRIEPDATRAAKGKVGAADPLHPGLVDLDPERLALGGGVHGGRGPSVVPYVGGRWGCSEQPHTHQAKRKN